MTANASLKAPSSPHDYDDRRVPQDRKPDFWRLMLKAARPHQWAKNFLLFIPIAMSHRLADSARALHVVLAFVAFCLCASGVYVLNDLVDLKSDRAHPSKRERPFASGRLGIGTGVAMIVATTGAAFGIAMGLLSWAAAAMLAIYIALTTSYSLFFKRKLMLDVLVLAALYTQRILIGGVAARVPVSEWLLAFSMFFFLSLAFAKRYTELSTMPVGVEGKIQGRGYWARDLDLVRTIGPSTGLVAVLVLALYINLSPEVSRLYSHPSVLYLVCPIVLYWICRVWFLAQRGQLNEDPVVFAVKDRVSLATGAAAVLLLLVASWAPPPWLFPGLG